jgi:choline dehydrogenase-like flavoprotein
MNTGNLTLRPNSIVMEVIYDKESKRASGVRIIDAETMKTEEYYAKVIFLNASTIGTTAILLNSVSDVFPNGLGNSSDQVGRNLMDHHYRVGASGTYEGFSDKYTFGRRPNGIYVPRFRNLDEKTKMKDFLRGYGFQGGGSRGRAQNIEGVGADFKAQVTEPGLWSMWIGAWGEHLPYADNTVKLNKEKKDKWGLPTLDISCDFRENELNMRKDMRQTLEETLTISGLKDVTSYDDPKASPGLCIHEMGTARMGRDPKTSVLNKWNQMHEVKNVFITDGACMTSSANQNPSVTYMALTARAVDFAVGELKKRNI